MLHTLVSMHVPLRSILLNTVTNARLYNIPFMASFELAA